MSDKSRIFAASYFQIQSDFAKSEDTARNDYYQQLDIVMKRVSLLLSLLLLGGMGLMAQSFSYEYDYDQAGNRIRRSVVRLSMDSQKGNEGVNLLSFTDELPDGNRITLFPNPTQGVIHFEIGQPDDKLGHFRLFDLKGALLMEGVCESNAFDLDLSKQPNGIYLIEFRNKNRVYSNKIIKE